MSAEDDRLEPVLRYLGNRAEQSTTVGAVQRYHVSGHAPYAVHQDDDLIAEVPGRDDVLYVVYGRAYGRALEPYLDAGWLQVHGGVVRIGETRVLFVGAKGAGKTTLALRLAFDGHGFEGDELVLTRDGVALPLPRNLHVKEGTRSLVPELAEHWDALPSTATDAGGVIRAFDPAEAGLSWSIGSGPVDVALVLEAGHRTPVEVGALSGVELVQELVPHTMPSSASRGDLLRGLSRLVGHCDGHRVRVGPLADTARAIVALVGGGGRRG